MTGRLVHLTILALGSTTGIETHDRVLIEMLLVSGVGTLHWSTLGAVLPPEYLDETIVSWT